MAFIPTPPRDRTRTEHIGVVERIIHASADRDFVILATTDGHTIVGEADAAEFPKGTAWRWLGRWEDDPHRGPRFRFSTCVQHLMHGKTGVVTYLTRTCEGLGQKTADRLWDKYAWEAVEVLRTDPDRVAREVPRLSPEFCRRASEELVEAKQFEATRIDLFNLTAGRGFGGSFIDAAIRKWGVKAPERIRKNPFAMLGMPRAGFKRCDKLWTDLGLPADAIRRGVACCEHLLATEPTGHTWVDAAALGRQLREVAPGCDDNKAFRVALRAGRVKKRRDDRGVLWLASYGRAAAEERVAAAVGRLMAGRSRWPTDGVPVSRQEGDGLPSEHQVERLRRATVSPLGILIGGPGTGKTHVTAFLVREVIRRFGRESILACAPTGKASVRMTQAFALAGIGLRARTIHSTLEIGRNGHDGGGWGFKRNRGNPLDATFVLADEASMDDATLMADLLDAVGEGGHLLLIGDAGQLPPVGHGAPLRDMLAAGVPHGELTEVRRNSGMIVHACVRVRANESFDVLRGDEPHDLDAKPAPRNLKFVEAADAPDAAAKLCDLVANARGRLGFGPVWQTQVIVARNAKGEVSRKALNEKLHPMLNPDGYAVAGNPFKVGDKIICLRNSWMSRVDLKTELVRLFKNAAEYMSEESPADPALAARVWNASNYVEVRDEFTDEAEQVYVANGEIGRVVAVAAGRMVARMSEADQLVRVPVAWKKGDEADDDEGDGEAERERGRGCDFDHAYAITCHKAQGAESPCVIVVGDDGAHRLTTREWLYTAISRASKLCVLVGQMSTFDKMRARTSLPLRKTFLVEGLREVLWRSL